MGIIAVAILLQLHRKEETLVLPKGKLYVFKRGSMPS